MSKFTKKELEKMVENFGYGTMARYAAMQHAKQYDFDSDTLNVEECVVDAFVGGISWCLESLKDNNDKVVVDGIQVGYLLKEGEKETFFTGSTINGNCYSNLRVLNDDKENEICYIDEYAFADCDRHNNGYIVTNNKEERDYLIEQNYAWSLKSMREFVKEHLFEHEYMYFVSENGEHIVCKSEDDSVFSKIYCAPFIEHVSKFVLSECTWECPTSYIYANMDLEEHWEEFMRERFNSLVDFLGVRDVLKNNQHLYSDDLHLRPQEWLNVLLHLYQKSK